MLGGPSVLLESRYCLNSVLTIVAASAAQTTGECTMKADLHFEEAPTLMRALRRHFGKVLAVFTICIGGAAAYTAFAPTYYGSEAKLFVRLGRESIGLDPTATTGQTISVQ